MYRSLFLPCLLCTIKTTFSNWDTAFLSSVIDAGTATATATTTREDPLDGL
jgi:hypothetical protein